MGESELLLVVLDGSLSTQEAANLIEKIKAIKGVEFVRTKDGIVQDVLEAHFSRERKD